MADPDGVRGVDPDDFLSVDVDCVFETAQTQSRTNPRCEWVGGKCEGENQCALWGVTHPCSGSSSRLPTRPGGSVCREKTALEILSHGGDYSLHRAGLGHRQIRSPVAG